MPDEPAARLAALSYFAMVSPGAKLRHTLDGQQVNFRTVKGSFLEKSWGYLARWYVLDRGEGAVETAQSFSGSRRWDVCSELVPNARCVGWRCGLEFKMPMRTAAVGWFIGLHT